MEEELKNAERQLLEKSRSDRREEQNIKVLQAEVSRKENARARLEFDYLKSKENIAKLKEQIEEMLKEKGTPTKLGRLASTRSGR